MCQRDTLRGGDRQPTKALHMSWNAIWWVVKWDFASALHGSNHYWPTALNSTLDLHLPVLLHGLGPFYPSLFELHLHLIFLVFSHVKLSFDFFTCGLHIWFVKKAIWVACPRPQRQYKQGLNRQPSGWRETTTAEPLPPIAVTNGIPTPIFHNICLHLVLCNRGTKNLLSA